MRKKATKGKQEERYYYNEHDDNQVSQLYMRRKKKKRKLRLKRIIFVLGIILVIAFVISPYSRVGTLKIKGCQYISEDDILNLIDIDENSFHATVFSSTIEKKLLASGIVKNVECKRGFFNGIEIVIEEATPLAYQENEVNAYLVGLNGDVYTVKKEVVSNMHLTTRLLNFTELSYLEKFAKQYVKVPESIRSLISDITYSPIDPYDKDQIVFDMNDGKKVYIHDLNNLASEMKYYQEILSTKPDACVYDIHGKNVYASDCE